MRIDNDMLMKFFNDREFYPENIERTQEFFDVIRELISLTKEDNED